MKGDTLEQRLVATLATVGNPFYMYKQNSKTAAK